MKEGDRDLVSCAGSPSRTVSIVGCGEGVIGEMLERNRRSHFLVYGYIENGDSKQDQIQRDKVLAKDILKEIGITDTNMKSMRLGGFDPTKLQRPDLSRFICHFLIMLLPWC
ncbi:hypothetical protein Trydic_g16157 [Trypoxylus dichotomus]